MPTLKELAERRAPVGAEIRKMADTLGETKPDFTAEERSKWEQLNKDFNAITAQMEIVRKADEVSGILSAKESDDRTKPGLEDTDRRSKKKKREDGADTKMVEELRAVALQAWCRKQMGKPLTRAQVDACKRTGFNPNRRAFDVPLFRQPLMNAGEKRALTIATGSSGGYTIPQGFVYNLEKALLDYNGMRQVAAVMRTDSGNLMPWPTNNDTSNAGTLVSANTVVGETDPVFGQVQFSAYKFTSNMVQVPTELLEDTAFNLSDELSMMLGVRLARGQEPYFTTGTGTGQPQGCVTGATVGVTAASDTAIAPDEVISLIHSVDPAYRRDPSFGIMFHDQILAVIRKLKDNVGRYLFEEGQNGAPDRLKGAKITINQNMASTLASGNKTMMAGAFAKFKIRDVNQVRIMRLVERYADADQVGFVAFVRSDSRLLDAGTHPVATYQHP